MGPAWPEDQSWGHAWVSAAQPALAKAALSTPGQEAVLKNYLGLKKKKALGQGGHTKKGWSCFSVQRAQVSPSGRVDSSWTFTLPRGLCDKVQPCKLSTTVKTAADGGKGEIYKKIVIKSIKCPHMYYILCIINIFT